jgi:hypothetical protein
MIDSKPTVKLKVPKFQLMDQLGNGLHSTASHQNEEPQRPRL